MGKGVTTVFGKTTVILRRPSEDRWELVVSRSFADCTSPRPSLSQDDSALGQALINTAPEATAAGLDSQHHRMLPGIGKAEMRQRDPPPVEQHFQGPMIDQPLQHQAVAAEPELDYRRLPRWLACHKQGNGGAPHQF